MSELKPCPKCNGEASIEYENYDFDGGDWWLIREADVVCLECGLVFHAENESREYQQGEHCLDFIIEAWNTRAEQACRMFPSYYYPCAEDDCMRLKVRMWTCSECETDHVGSKPNYCPHCGAKVVSE